MVHLDHVNACSIIVYTITVYLTQIWVLVFVGFEWGVLFNWIKFPLWSKLEEKKIRFKNHTKLLIIFFLSSYWLTLSVWRGGRSHVWTGRPGGLGARGAAPLFATITTSLLISHQNSITKSELISSFNLLLSVRTEKSQKPIWVDHVFLSNRKNLLRNVKILINKKEGK